MHKIAKLLVLFSLTLGLPAMAQVFDCTGSAFTTSAGSCSVGISATGKSFGVFGTTNGATPSVTSGNVLIGNSGITHWALDLMYQTPVDIRAFTTIFTFKPNGQNFAFTINNCGTGNPGCGGGGTGFSYFGLNEFSSGASCEMGFYQEYSGNPFPINVFALGFDQYGGNAGGSNTFTYSSVQIYQQNESPCNGNPGGTPTNPYYGINKASTSPVPLNSPTGTRGTTTGDTYSATLSYDGSTLNLCLYDVTAANGSCSSSTSGTGTFFTQSWSNVSIPSQVNGTTGYIGFTASTGAAATADLIVTGWKYTVNTASASPGSTATSAGSSTAANPTFSPAPGTYASAQNVTISCSTGSSNIAYALSATPLTVLPLANNLGGAAVGTAYSTPVTISSTTTLYANCGVNNNSNPGFLPSGVVQGTYTIASAAATPTFSPTAGVYSTSQSVTISSTSSGAIICYNTTGSPSTNGATGCGGGSSLYSGAVTVPASETIYAVAGGTGYSDSPIGSAAYTISASGTPTSSRGNRVSVGNSITN